MLLTPPLPPGWCENENRRQHGNLHGHRSKAQSVEMKLNISPDAPHDSLLPLVRVEGMLCFLSAWHDAWDTSLALSLIASPLQHANHR